MMTANDLRLSLLHNLLGGLMESVAEDEMHELLAETAIRIVVGQRAVTEIAGQVLMYQAATLLARLFDHVTLVGDEGVASQLDLLSPGTAFLPALRALLPTLRSYPVAAPARETDAAPGGIEVTLMIGDDLPSVEDGAAVYIGCTPWGVRLSLESPQPVAATHTTIGALAAGALAAAEVFKRVFTGRLRGAYSLPSYNLSLLTYQPLDDNDEEPLLPERIEADLVLFGCGSLGCAFLQGLLLTPQLTGKLVSVDNGRFDQRNPFKYALIDQHTAEQGAYKAVWTVQRLREIGGGRMRSLAFVGTAAQYIASLPVTYTILLAVSAVDTPEGRLEIQEGLPRRIINAGVDGTSVEVSVHGFGDGACLACLQLQAAHASWRADEIAHVVGLTAERVYALIRNNEVLSPADVEHMSRVKALDDARRAELASYVGQQLLSYYHRMAYSEAVVEQLDASEGVRVTTAFVSAFGGVLLLVEALKELLPALAGFRVRNAYQQQLLGVPAGGTYTYARDESGACACRSSFRLRVYAEKYGGVLQARLYPFERRRPSMGSRQHIQ